MSGITSEMPVLSASAFGDSGCAQCGSELAEDQEWCLECGAARTLIHRPPDWRVPLAVVAAVILLVLAGFTIALVNLSSTANDATRTIPEANAQPASAPARPGRTGGAAATTPASGAATAIGSWPVGLSGWTVVLFTSHDKPTADATARRLAGRGLRVGVLDSSQHPSMIAGYWVVFSGRYPDRSRAATAAARLLADGNPAARARRVARPGGL